MAALPIHGSHIFVGFAIPCHISIAGDAGVSVVLIERKADYGQIHIGIAGQRARVAATGGSGLGIGRIADVPGRFIGGIKGLE